MNKITYTYLAAAAAVFVLFIYVFGWITFPASLVGVVLGVVIGLDLAAIKYRKEVAQILEDLELQLADD